MNNKLNIKPEQCISLSIFAYFFRVASLGLIQSNCVLHTSESMTVVQNLTGIDAQA
jgi:hypothetical protein